MFSMLLLLSSFLYNSKFNIFVSLLLDDSSVHVTGSLAYGVFDGHIHTKDEIYSIEPSSR